MRSLDDTQILRTKTAEAFANAIQIARNLNAAINNFCPSCLNILERTLSTEEQVQMIYQGREPERKTISQTTAMSQTRTQTTEPKAPTARGIGYHEL
jgi:hypothetical protein